MRNYPLGIFGNIRSPADCGFLFQNLLYLILTQGRRWDQPVSLLAYKDKAEVDFVVEKGRPSFRSKPSTRRSRTSKSQVIAPFL